MSALDDTWVEASLQTCVACVLWLAREGHPELACRLRDEYLTQWGIDASTWNDTIDAMISGMRARHAASHARRAPRR